MSAVVLPSMSICASICNARPSKAADSQFRLLFPKQTLTGYYYLGYMSF